MSAAFIIMCGPLVASLLTPQLLDRILMNDTHADENTRGGYVTGREARTQRAAKERLEALKREAVSAGAKSTDEIWAFVRERADEDIERLLRPAVPTSADASERARLNAIGNGIAEGVPSASDAALGRGDAQARVEFIEAAQYEPAGIRALRGEEGVVLDNIHNMPAAIRLSTLATKTDERDELGAAVSRLAQSVAEAPLLPREIDTNTIEVAVRMILEALGEDVSRPSIRETPARVARFYQEFIGWEAGRIDTTFAEEQVADQMVTVSDILIWSMCEHHMLPFSTKVSIGYIARGRLIGLSKLPRIAHAVGHKLQTQENIAEQIADLVSRIAGTPDVAVLCSDGQHTCAVMRGIRTECSMNNSVLRGAFRRHEVRDEFYTLINRR